MSEGDVSVEEGNALLECREQQNEREAQHQNESTSTFNKSVQTYKLVVAILVGVLLIIASSASGVIRFYQTEDNGRLDRRTVAKLFYQAVAIDLSGGDINDLNQKLNKMYDYECDRIKLLHNPRFLAEAEEMKAHRVVKGMKERAALLKDRDAFEAIRRLAKAVEKNPEVWEYFVKNNK
tara:strand:- start:293 stop:829 length:537 start_codon:yes stop_codon:yes gene_type:complete